ncbi:hypothetical protein WMY93_008308 [Mugilogobius chulae]|uniref:Uncharacterized protein n=1 Tax=Mugilogobius chulae TaxID=88201 RepID=A0AAW0PFX7_9GOBI
MLIQMNRQGRDEADEKALSEKPPAPGGKSPADIGHQPDAQRRDEVKTKPPEAHEPEPSRPSLPQPTTANHSQPQHVITGTDTYVAGRVHSAALWARGGRGEGAIWSSVSRCEADQSTPGASDHQPGRTCPTRPARETEGSIKLSTQN